MKKIITTFASPPPSFVTSSPLENSTTKTNSSYEAITNSVKATHSYSVAEVYLNDSSVFVRNNSSLTFKQSIQTSQVNPSSTQPLHSTLNEQIILKTVLEPSQNTSQLFLSDATGYIDVNISTSSSYKSGVLLQSFPNHSESHRFRTIYKQQTEVSQESFGIVALASSSVTSVKVTTENGYSRPLFHSYTKAILYSLRSDISLSAFIRNSSMVQSSSARNGTSSYFTNVKIEMTISASFQTTTMERTHLITYESLEEHNTSAIMSTPFISETGKSNEWQVRLHQHTKHCD